MVALALAVPGRRASSEPIGHSGHDIRDRWMVSGTSA
jgi:hypothetical protein